MALLIFFLIQFFIYVNCFLNPVNPLLCGSQLVIGKFGKNILENSKLDANTTRKIIHISTAPTFISTWVLYNDYYPKLWASSVPFIASLYLIYKKDNLAKIISRSGNSKEIFKGPLIYTGILSLLTYNYWLDDPTGMIAMTQLSIGDGFADIIGRRFGKTKWIHNNKKSVEGTIGYLVSSIIGTQILVNIYYHYNFNFWKIVFFSTISCLVETIPGIDDNISIPVSIIFLNYLLTNF